MAQDLAAGKSAAEAGDFAKALENWQPLAEQGHTAAQYNLGMMHARGDGVEKDLTKAAEWFRRAAEQGHVESQARLGAMSVRGIGVEEDPEAAIKWLKLAAEQHHTESQFDLGVMYANGNGVPRNHGTAYFWFTIAGLQDFRPAREAQMRIRRLMPGAQIGQVEQRVRDWLEQNTDMRFERQGESSPLQFE
jgi:TPR repeat protein